MSQTGSATNPLGTEKISKLMVRFAVPSIIALVVNSLYNMVDQVFIGRGVGFIGNAATNVILPIMTVVMAVGLMIGDGCATFMSLNMGKGKVDKAADGVGNAIVLAIGFGVIYTILCQIFLEPLCWMFGATKESISYCLGYGRPIVLGFTFISIAGSFTSIVRADGRANVGMIGMFIGCFVNLILDPIFIFVFKWGVAGAAWATITGQFLNAVFFIYQITRCKTVKLEKKNFKLQGKIVGKICAFGLSSFITQFAAVIVLGVVNNTLKSCGANSIYGSDIPVSAMGIVMKISQVLTSAVLGLATGILPIISYNYGSKQYDRVKKTFKNAIVISTAVMLVCWAFIELFPLQIISIFGTQDELYMEFARMCLQIFMGALMTAGASIVIGIFFQAIGRPAQATVLTLLRQIVIFVPTILILGSSGDVTKVLWAGPVADSLSCIVSLIVLAAFWKKVFNDKEGVKA